MSEIIYVCKSINNKNVREGELNILRKCNKDDLCFEFGESEINLKKRYYNNEKDFEDDFKALEKLRESDKSKNNKEEVTQETTQEVEKNKDEFKGDKARKPKYNDF